jgi:hypothetical protein
LVPVPKVRDLEELNLLLAAGSKEEESRVIQGRTQPNRGGDAHRAGAFDAVGRGQRRKRSSN